MSKWALWAAHRYVRAGAAVPRLVGPDGRLLARPWRVRSEDAIAAARAVRGLRRQPWWPRLLGLFCIGLACMFAIDPVGSIPTDVAAFSSARPAPRLASPCALPGRAANSGGPPEFRWRAGDAEPPYSVVVLDAGYAQVLRRDGIETTRWQADAAAAAVLRGGGTFHWYVLADALGRPVASPLATVEFE